MTNFFLFTQLIRSFPSYIVCRYSLLHQKIITIITCAFLKFAIHFMSLEQNYHSMNLASPAHWFLSPSLRSRNFYRRSPLFHLAHTARRIIMDEKPTSCFLVTIIVIGFLIEIRNGFERISSRSNEITAIIVTYYFICRIANPLYCHPDIHNSVFLSSVFLSLFRWLSLAVPYNEGFG